MNLKVVSVLDETLNRLELTRYEVALQSRIRPSTVSDLANNKSKSIKFDTAAKLIDGIEQLSGERISMNDILRVTTTN